MSYYDFTLSHMSPDAIAPQGQQYVRAGKLIALQTMVNVMNYLKVQKVDITKASSLVCLLLYRIDIYIPSIQ